MMDSQEMLPVEEQVTEMATENEITVENQPENAQPQTQEEVVAQLKEWAESDTLPERVELDTMKQVFYKIHKNNVAAAHAAFIENGGNAEDFIPTPNVLEDEFKEVMNVIRQKKAAFLAEQERIKAENLERKLAILDRIKSLSSSPEEANQGYKEFKELQTTWKEITDVPADKANELWKNYQALVEQFYDLLKLNHELREYDFKKNLEIKTRLCETAEKLGEEEEVITAFQQLQALHQEWKETGPVAKELRDEIWNRFKAASTIVNKRHQQHFEDIKAREEENLQKKTALCEQVESIDLTAIHNHSEWETHTAAIIELQKEWRTIGFAPQKQNVKIFERFRNACDIFFTAKAEYFKQLKESQNENLAKKTALCEAAEALKESTDWKATSDKLIQLQKEWRTIGSVPKKFSDSLWKRFNEACDYFFEQKNKNTASQRSEEKENLVKKQAVIEQLNALLESEDEQKSETLKALMKEWNEIGFVPFKEKDRIYKAYREAVDQIYKTLNMSAARRKLDSFKNTLKNDHKDGEQGIRRERERLVRQYETKRNEIKTYENNLGFLTCNSKKGNSLVNEMNKKMEKLKDDLKLIEEKIAAIDAEMFKE